MGICKPRYFMIIVCVLQLLAIIQRQVFDFLGFLWISILLNFFEIVFIIFGFFGVFQYRLSYVLWYVIWHAVWIGWNVFIICLYLELGGISYKDSKVLKLDPDSGSWWQNGPGCKGDLNMTLSIPAWENIKNCLVDYRHVEIFQAGLQCLLAVLGILFNICMIRMLLKVGGNFSRGASGTRTKTRSLYSIEFSQPLDSRHTEDGCEHNPEQLSPQTSPKPMTPRRVKRRSVMTRGSSSRQSTSSRRRSNSSTRSSTRNSRRIVQNPVTQLLDQQQQCEVSFRDNLPNYSINSNVVRQNWQCNGHSNPMYQQSSMQSLNEPDDVDDLYNNRPASVRSSYSNFHGTRSMGQKSLQRLNINNQATPQVPQKKVRLSDNQRHSSIFLNSGPPAYSVQGHTVPDVETAM